MVVPRLGCGSHSMRAMDVVPRLGCGSVHQTDQAPMRGMVGVAGSISADVDLYRNAPVLKGTRRGHGGIGEFG